MKIIVARMLEWFRGIYAIPRENFEKILQFNWCVFRTFDYMICIY